ncbi:amidohydrolase family protein [Aquibium sp. LZ166]|uniref:Amidohydrolase family protein n=1 Tax=Aquibium pacificus TaxID=3153579 RepID=A0ABV3SFH3_9HYPH
MLAQAKGHAVSQVTDVHTHIVPPVLPNGKGRDARWPSIQHGENGDAAVMIAGEVFRRIDSSCWDAERRLEDMRADGVDIQVISPMPELLSTWFSPADGDELARAMNEFIARMMADTPGRFRGIGMVPVQDPELAARRLADVKAMGLSGVEIGTHIDGVPLGDRRLDAFFAAAEENDLCIMVHPLHPAGMERLVGPADLGATAAFPLETALAAVSLLTGGVMERFPGLKILLSHGGGALTSILPRLDHAWSIGMSLSRLMSEKPSEVARRFWFDSIVYDPRALTYIADMVGDEHLVLGSDYPFSIQQPQAAAFVGGALGELRSAKVMWRNAENFLGSVSAPAGLAKTVAGSSI